MLQVSDATKPRGNEVSLLRCAGGGCFLRMRPFGCTSPAGFPGVPRRIAHPSRGKALRTESLTFADGCFMVAVGPSEGFGDDLVDDAELEPGRWRKARRASAQSALRAAAFSWSFHRMVEQGSGLMTEYQAFSIMTTRSPTPMPSAPPLAPSPMTMTMTGTRRFPIS